MQQLLQAFGGPGRTALSFAPTYSMYPEYARDTHTAWVAGRRAERLLASTCRTRCDADRRAPAVGGPAGLAQQPDRHRAGARRRRGGARRSRRAWSSWTRPTASSGAPACRARWRCCRRHPRLVVTRTMSKAFALAGGRLGLPRRVAGGGRRGAHRPAAVPPVGGHARPWRGSALAHADELLGAGRRRCAASGTRTVDWLRGTGLQARRLRRQLRAVRDVRRPARRVAGSARARCADPRDRSGRAGCGCRSARRRRWRRSAPRWTDDGRRSAPAMSTS